MTVSEAIERSKALYPECEKRRNESLTWLGELEAKIYAELYGDKKCPTLSERSSLSAPSAYAEMYPLYLVMKTDLLNADIERYNNSACIFENAYSEFANYVNRTATAADITYYKFK